MAIDHDQIMRYFRLRHTFGRGHYRDNVTCQLAAMILQQHEFPDVHSFVAFCEDPDNLRSWLPSGDDRVVFSADLVQTLRAIRAA